MASEPRGSVSIYKQAPTDRLQGLTLPKPLPAKALYSTSFLELITTLQPSPLTYELLGFIFGTLPSIFHEGA